MHQQSIGTAAQSRSPAHQHVTQVPRFAQRFDDVTQAIHATLHDAQLQIVPNLFRVNAGVDLFDVYLGQFDPADRQYHNCNCCRSFIHRFGSLVTIYQDGRIKSAIWDETKLGSRHPYRKVVKALREAVERGHVVDQFFWDEQEWGHREAGGWTHLWTNPGVKSHSGVKGADQIAAEQRENRRHLAAALDDFQLNELEKVLGMLTHGGLARADKLLPMATFLVQVQKSVLGVRGEPRNRRLWFNVAMAGAGWCTPRSSALGALIEDVRAGHPTHVVERKHAERMDPLKYQRPTAAPTAGNVAQAERLFERMGLAPALQRRHARADEVVFEWKPQWKGVQPGIFGHLLVHQRGNAERALLGTKAQPITYARFKRDVLPQAIEMEVVVPHHGQFIAITTAVNPDAPPILQWDSLECRNPFAWYVYNQGSPASNWGLRPGRAKVVGITLQPSQWGRGLDGGHHGSSAILMIEGAADQRSSSLALFPECLRSELHEVRSTVEAHSRSQQLAKLPRGTQNASGLRVSDGSPAEVWVRTAQGTARYVIDRME
ncbi:hypothetical protein vBSmQDWS359_39 [Stenotrophomonas phage vB_Sm_QDWS359]|uniref:Uncharacterized protein n=1 Tax=Stenotrophomonas phage vB_Sm_QDWS359 TaxID=2943841 RepID=A0A9E7IWN8_9CAUD|nr:hypothetical protein P9A46_gp39 [Stenotrophomonas phage vB_Sm_QDWS359]UQM93949.1 hypothetical protein vBSmQDWS359_39 [Stenotrophomonas phage vB_Sm_QDWS359]